MRKKVLILFILFALPFITQAQQNDAVIVKNMLEQANDMGKKFIAKDYKAFLKYSHPLVIQSMGGEKTVYDQTIADLKALQEQEITFLSINFGVPSKIVSVGDERQSVIPELIEMRVPGGKLTNTASMLAISPDKGANWYFVDTGGHNLVNMQLLLPSLSNELIIPPAQDPSFEEDSKTD